MNVIEVYNRLPICAEYSDGSLRIKCLGTSYTVAPDGEIRTYGYINPRACLYAEVPSY